MRKQIFIFGLAILVAGCGGHQINSREPRAFQAERGRITWNTFQNRIIEGKTAFKQYEGAIEDVYKTAMDYYKAEPDAEQLLEFHDLVVIGKEKTRSYDPYNVKIFAFYKQKDLHTVRVDCEVDYYDHYEDQAKPLCPALFETLGKSYKEVKPEGQK